MAQIYKIYFNKQNLCDFILPFISGIFVKTINKRTFNAKYVLRMDSFGKKIAECRKAKGYSQSELARKINTHYSIIGKYERDEVKPTIDVIKKLAHELDTTVGYLAGETQDQEVFKDPVMLKRLQQINSLPEEDKAHILYAIDNLLASAATRLTYGK
jgi:transcriptional regulator with XRE-family HTH domain